MLLHDDEMEALEAALSFVDAFSHDGSVILHASEAPRGSPIQSSSPSVPTSVGLSGGGGVIADEELESLLLEVGLSGSPSTNSGVKTEPAALVATSQAASPTDSAAVANNSFTQVNSNDSENARRVSRGGTEQATSGKTKKRVRLNPNRARDNRKNELAYLRNKVKQMEEQLLSLRQQYIENKDSTNTTTTTRSIVETVGMPPVWRDMASTQQLRREKAERENARLKLVLESQIKLAKSMEAVMQRRTRQQLAGFNGVVSDAVGGVQGSTWDLLLDKDTYDTLLARAESAYHEVDEVLAANGLKYLETACTNAQMREGPEGMYVDIFTNKMLPFDFKTAAEAVWTHFRGSEKHRGNLYENFSKDVESSSDTVAEMFAIEFMANDLAADFRVKQVVRRYIEEDRQVVVWVSTASALENSKSPFASFGFREKGYVISKRVRGRDDFSMFQTCCLVSPQMSEGGSFDLSTVGTFTEFVLGFMFATITSSQQLIENMLMDQSLQPSRDKTAMSLLFGDDEVEALEAALSYVEALPPSQPALEISAASSTTAFPEGFGAGDEGEVRLDAELDRLLLGTLSSSSEHVSESTPMAAMSTTLVTTPMASSLSSPLPLMVANVGAPNVSGQTRRRSRAAKGPTTTLAKRRVKVNPNRARDERKHELAYLRNKVEQMETELETMRHRRRTRGIRSAEPPPDSRSQALTTTCSKPAASSSKMPFIWRDIATRQQHRREKSERENARLKLVLESQVKLAKSMEILLQKRARQQVSGCAEVVGASGDLSSQGCTLDFLVDKDTYEALLTSVETAYAELEAVFATNGLLGLDTPCRDARMREGVTGMYLDVFANKVLPFTYEAVTAAVWNHFKGSEKHRGVVYENATKHLETSSDTIMEAFTMEFLGKTTTADFRVKQVIRRFVESDRQVVVWVSIGHALDPNNSPFSSFGFVDKGYVVTRRPMSIAPGHGDFTILQMCSLVSPQMSAGCRIDMTAAGDFTEFVLNVVAANTTTSQEIIENVLLDQALNKRQVETSLAA
ncbi:hypothetical protein JG687_00005005 [Phytophthora cactorum]|uniref:M96 mating-specific protein family n=1 Tax=Phytophthora cactorum TaxID=29920 RepID=A0A8T1UM46_9STRA|nr:hypothetical protein JG687_00005005 [Phytophthora cactorum]